METEKHPFIFYSPKAESIIPFHPYDSKNMNEERTGALKSSTSVREIHIYMLGVFINRNRNYALCKGDQGEIQPES